MGKRRIGHLESAGANYYIQNGKQDPTVSTENYVQYPLRSHDGKEYIYICFFVVLEKPTFRGKNMNRITYH